MRITDAPLQLFAPTATRELGERVAVSLGLPLSPLEERSFEDGEHKIRPLASVRGRDVYVLQSLHGGPVESPNDKLCRLLFFVGALRDAGAARVTVVAPYLCYSRKERRTKPRDPVTTRYVAALIEAVGTDRFVTLDVHNLAAFQNAFRCPTEHLEAKGLFAARLAPALGDRDVVVVSPDAGGFKRADRFRESLARKLGRAVAMAFLEKKRSEGVVSGEEVVGRVDGRIAILFDDLISTGTTLCRAARACRERGAVEIWAVASHGLFMGGAAELMSDPAVTRLMVTDSVPPFRLDAARVRDRLEVVEIAPLLAAAVDRLHEGGSIVELVEA